MLDIDQLNIDLIAALSGYTIGVGVVPNGTAYPYVIINLISAPKIVEVFGKAQTAYSVLMQFSAYSNGLSDAWSTINGIISSLEHTPPALTGMTCLASEQSNLRQLVEQEKDTEKFIYQCSVDFEFLIQA
jgi:hypothetical protein